MSGLLRTGNSLSLSGRNIRDKESETMKPSAFYLLINGETHGPYQKSAIATAVYSGEISLETLYSYERARAWRPLTHLIGHVDPQIIEKNRKLYFVAVAGETLGPFSRNELRRKFSERAIDHQ